MLVLFAGLLLPSPRGQAHDRKVSLVSAFVLTQDPGQSQDEMDVTIDMTNYNPYPLRVSCELEGSTSWYPDADNDGFNDTFSPERYRSPTSFRTRIGRSGRYSGKDKTIDVHVVVPHPDKGQESFDFYGDDHFSGWEHGQMDTIVSHCHGKRAA